MAKTRLNSTERRVIIRKIRDGILDMYDIKRKEILDAYVPSASYIAVQNSIELLKQALSKTNYNSSYFGNLGYVSNETFGQRVLDDIRNDELKEELPEYPYIHEEDIEDELILKGLDKDWSVEKLIKSYVDKFNV